jgi:hypothetical protein
MTVPPRRHHLSREQRRALKVLARAPRGVSKQALMVARGFSAELLAGLVLAEFAIQTIGDDRVERILITAVGRQALESITARRPSPRPPETR